MRLTPADLARFGSAPALQDSTRTLSYAQLAIALQTRMEQLAATGRKRIAIEQQNSIEWVLNDLACQALSLIVLPLPAFFSPQQRQHALTDAGVELLITDAGMVTLPSSERLPVIPEGTGKITFTSGSTGQPKGVCLSHHHLLRVAESLRERIQIAAPKHLCVLPLALLLENVAGVYAPLLAGGCLYLATDEERGFTGSRLTVLNRLLALISRVNPTSMILVPELLQAMMFAAAHGWQPPASLTFIAVGGAKVAAQLLTQARALGLPVYQGYGLSECGSVVALNTAKNAHDESVGHVLPHQRVRFEDGECVVSGEVFLGYLNQPASFYPSEVNTGDIGEMRGKALHIDGRKTNLLISSYGRNISPEWVESVLMATGAFLQVLVFGEAQPALVCLLCPVKQDTDTAVIQQAIDTANSQLPDYANVLAWHRIPAWQQLPEATTATGKPRRPVIERHYHAELQRLYHTLSFPEVGV